MSRAEPERTRVAACRCGRLTARCEGEPVRVSVCHCLACQRRSGSAFAVQARFPAERVKVLGEAKTYVRTADSGRTATYRFCPTCGSTMAYETQHMPGLVAVPVGAFADPGFPAPWFSVWEARRHPWAVVDAEGVEHSD